MELLKFWKLIWAFYRAKNPLHKLIIVWIWAPNLVDVDNLRNAYILTDAWYDVIVPDYYGFCRSEGKFTPMNSIRTFLDTKKFFSDWIATNVYTWENFKISYKDFIFLGLSYGWGAALLLPKFDKTIKKIWVFYPITNYTSLGKYWGKEETVEDFLNSINLWFKKIYKWINLPVWEKHFEDKTNLIPLENIKYLKNTTLFLAHGTKDISICYEKTKEFYEKLKKLNPQGNYCCNLYENLWHGKETMIPATIDFIKRLDSHKCK